MSIQKIILATLAILLSNNAVASDWYGSYKPLSHDGKKLKSYLAINGSTISWMDCNEVNVRIFISSSVEHAVQLDPKARCSWAGWIVALKRSAPDSFLDIRVNAYRNLDKYKLESYSASYPYSKLENVR